MLDDAICQRIDPIRAHLHHFVQELPDRFEIPLEHGDPLNKFIDQLQPFTDIDLSSFRIVDSDKADFAINRQKENHRPFWMYNRTTFMAKAKGLESTIDNLCGNSRRSSDQRAVLAPTTINVNPTMNQHATATASARAEAKTVSQGDLTGLLIALSGLGLTSEGQQQLREAIESDEAEYGEPQIGARVRDFLSDLSIESLGGVGTQLLLASPERLPQVLHAIGQFFGSIS